jgi:hypothetical protein
VLLEEILLALSVAGFLFLIIKIPSNKIGNILHCFVSEETLNSGGLRRI